MLAFHRAWLIAKFEEILRRTVLAIRQLDDEELNWRPNDNSHSIATLVKHIEGNVQERVVKGILKREIQRNREEELMHEFITKSQLIERITGSLELTIHTIDNMSAAKFEEKQQVRKRERTNLDMLHQCAAHYSEHMGQILYIAKMCKNEDYISTSI